MWVFPIAMRGCICTFAVSRKDRRGRKIDGSVHLHFCSYQDRRGKFDGSGKKIDVILK